MQITSKKDHQQHLGRTGFYAWELEDGGRIVARGTKAISNEPLPTWKVRHDRADGVIDVYSCPNWQRAGAVMWGLMQEHQAVLQ